MQVARGAVTMNGFQFKEGDGAAITDKGELRFEQGDQAEVMVCDMQESQ